MLRLTAIAGDLGSLIANFTGVGSVASAGIGATSTALNQAADMAEGQGFWQSLGNNLTSYGLDAISVLPFAKAAKIPKMIKTLAKFTPYVTGAISTAQGIANAPEMLNSWSKIKNGQDLTIADWRNIANSIQIVLGGTAATGRAIKANKKVNAALSDTHSWLKTNNGYRKVSNEDIQKIQGMSSLEEQNKFLKEKYGVTISKQKNLFKRKKNETGNIETQEYYDLSKPVTLYSGDLPYTRKFGWGERAIGNLQVPSLPNIGVRNVYNKYIHPQAYKRFKNQQSKSTTKSEQPVSEQPKSSAPKETTKTILGLPSPQTVTKRRIGPISTELIGRARADLTNHSKFRKPGSHIYRIGPSNIPNNVDANSVIEARTIYPTKRLDQFIEDRIPGGLLYGQARQKRAEEYRDVFQPIIEKEQNKIWSNFKATLQNEVNRKKVAQADAERVRKRRLNTNTQRSLDKQIALIWANMDNTPASPKAHSKRQKELNEAFIPSYIRDLDNSFKRQLPHKQSKKKKKTSRDDKVTRKQQGGVLDLTKIKKFQNAGKITLNNGVVDWDSLSDPKKDILWPGSAEYSKSPLSKYVVPRLGTSSGVNNVSKSQNYSFDTNSRLKSMIDRLKNNTISPDNISEMQRRHWGMYYTWQPQDTPIYKEQVANYQTDYQNLGLNDEIIAPGYSNNYIINSPNPNSGDSTPNWTSDGLYSQITDDRRVLARKADYDNNLEQLKKDIEYAKQNGYEYYLDPETDYYMLRPIKTNDTPKDPSRDLSKNNSSVRATSYSNPIRGWIKQLGLQTPDFISAGRLFGNILNNNTVSEETLKGLKPLLVDTYNLQKYVVGDLPTKQAFYGKAAQLENLASKPRTSDASLQLAGQLEANNRGNEIRLQGDLQDNNMIKTTRDQAWQIEADNIARRSAVANKNRESLLGINKAKHDINAARRSANWVSIENFLKEKEQKELKRQELQRNFDINQLQDNIQYEQLTDPVYISLKNKAISDNATPQQINEFQKYQTLMGQRYKNRLNNAYARLYNLRTTNGYVPIISSKKGGTLQKHKVELANEKLFQENIQNSVKNHITMINNLSQVTKELILKAMTL